jgi:hypothetical protein
MTNHRLAEVFAGVGAGRWPDPDGRVEVIPPPPGWAAAICAFTAHTIVASPVPAAEVLARSPADDLGAPMSAAFQAWLASVTGHHPGVLDAVLVASGTGQGKGALRPASAAGHPRVRRAWLVRNNVSVWSPVGGGAVVCVGTGLAGRREIAVEVDPTCRDAGLGRACIRDAIGLIARGEPVFAQVSPGNAASLRAFLAAGFVPIGSEVLFGRERAPGGGDAGSPLDGDDRISADRRLDGG